MPSLERITKVGHPVLYGFLVLWSFVELVLNAYLVAMSGYPNTSTRFLLFTSLLTFIISVAYIIFFKTASGSFLASIASHAGSIALVWIFFLSGAAALTHTLGGGLDCGGNNGFDTCTTLNASLGFAWLNWIWLTFILIAILVLGARSARSGNGFGGALV